MTVRPAVPADAAAIAAVYAHHVLHSTATSTSSRRRSRTGWPGWAEHDGGRYRALVAEDGGEVVGFAASSRFRARAAYDTTVETSVYLAPEVVGRGLGRALYAVLLEALAGEDVHRALAAVALPNPASEALHRSLGHTQVGHVHRGRAQVRPLRRRRLVRAGDAALRPGRVRGDGSRVGGEGAAGSRGIAALPPTPHRGDPPCPPP